MQWVMIQQPWLDLVDKNNVKPGALWWEMHDRLLILTSLECNKMPPSNETNTDFEMIEVEI